MKKQIIYFSAIIIYFLLNNLSFADDKSQETQNLDSNKNVSISTNESAKTEEIHPQYKLDTLKSSDYQDTLHHQRKMPTAHLG